MASITKENSVLRLSPGTFHNFALGILIFLYLSFTRGFVYIAVSVLINFVPDAVAAALGLLPLLGLFISVKHDIWKKSLPYTILIWLLAGFIPILQIRIILVLFGLMLVYGSFRYFVLSAGNHLSSSQVGLGIMFMVITDLIFKAPNRGTDPIIFSTFVGSIFSVLVAIAISLVLYANLSEVTELSSTSNLTRSQTSGRNISVFGFILALFIFMFYFSSSGSLTYFVLNSEMELNVGVLTLVTSLLVGSLVLFMVWFEEGWINFLIPIIAVEAVILVLSVLTYPWTGFAIILWIVGVEANLVLMMIALNVITKHPNLNPRGFSISLAVASVLNIGFVLISLLNESVTLQLVISSMTGILIFFGVILSKKEVS